MTILGLPETLKTIILNYQRNKWIINIYTNRWYHSYQIILVTKMEEQIQVAVKS